MKLLAGLFAAVLALDASDCPNDGWQLNGDKSKCVPADGQVVITCNANSMEVTLKADQLYVVLDSSHADEDASHATFTDKCKDTKGRVFKSSGSTKDSDGKVTDSDGTYTVTIPLDDCGTTVDQKDNKITFANKIIGNGAAITVDNIITTELLGLEVACVYADTFTVKVDDIGVQAGDFKLDSTSESQIFTGFSMASYSDVGFTKLVTATAEVVIGQPVYNRITPGTLPTNVNYVVKDCQAMSGQKGPVKACGDKPVAVDVNTPTVDEKALLLTFDTCSTTLIEAQKKNDEITKYNVIKDGCLDKLVDAKEITGKDLKGTKDETGVDFSFNGFTFQDTKDQLFLECSIVVCAIDDKGAFKDTSCGFTVGGKDKKCVKDNTMGYNVPTCFDAC